MREGLVVVENSGLELLEVVEMTSEDTDNEDEIEVDLVFCDSTNEFVFTDVLEVGSVENSSIDDAGIESTVDVIPLESVLVNDIKVI